MRYVLFIIAFLFCTGESSLAQFSVRSSLRDSLQYYEQHLMDIDQDVAFRANRAFALHYTVYDKNLALLYAYKMLDNSLNRTFKAISYETIGDIYYAAGEARNAIINYDKAIDEFRLSRNPKEIAGVLQKMARIYLYRSLFSQAMEKLFLAEFILKEEGDDFLLAQNDRKIARAAILSNNKELAAEYLASAFKIFLSLRDFRRTTKVVMSYIEVLSNLNSSEKSIDYLHRLSEIMPKDASKQDRAYLFNAYGCYYTFSPKLDSAIFYFQKALRLSDTNNLIEHSDMLSRLAHVYSLKNDWENTIKVNMQALYFRKKYGSADAVVSSWNNITGDYFANNDFPTGRKMLDSAWYYEGKTEGKSFYYPYLLEKEIKFYTRQKLYDSILKYSNLLTDYQGERLQNKAGYDAGLLRYELTQRKNHRSYNIGKNQGINRFFVIILLLVAILGIGAVLILLRHLKKKSGSFDDLREDYLTVKTDLTRNNLLMMEKDKKLNYHLTVLKKSPLAIICLENDFQITYLNDKFMEITGRHYQELISMDFFRFVSTTDIDSFQKHLEQYDANKFKMPHLNFGLKRKDGSEQRFIASTGKIDTGTQQEYVLAFYDPTYYDLALKAFRNSRDSSRKELDDSMNLLNYVHHKLLERLIINSADTDSPENHLSNEYRFYYFLLSSYAKILDANYCLSYELMHLPDLSEALKTQLRAMPDINLEWNYTKQDSAALASVGFYADKQLLLICLQAILQYFWECGMPEIRIDVYQEGEQLNLNISSSSKEDISGMDFDEQTTAGHPLLAMIFYLGRRSGEQLRFIPGESVAFYLSIGLKPQNLILESNRQKESSASYPNWKGKSILIAEDVQENYRLLATHINRTGAHHAHAEDGIRALEILSSGKKFDLVLMDIQMPGLNGLETFAILKILGIKIPVIAITAYAHGNESQLIKDMGFDAYIAKPFNANDLYDCLNAYL